MLVLVLVLPLPLGAQNPDTDIWLADFSSEGGRISVGAPRNVTARPGYDNHPWFTPDGAAIVYAADVDGQTDVFRLDIASGRSTRITTTPENEFSPMLLESGDLLVVRWQADMSDGHLWVYAPNGQPLRAHGGDVPRVGYYAWADDSTFAVFVNDSVQSFVLSDARTGRHVRIGQGLNGSPPRRIPGERAVSFMQRDTSGAWWIHRLELDMRTAAPLVAVPEGAASNYFWTPDGVLLVARGNELLAWDPERGGDWEVIVRFEEPGLQRITRFSIDAQGRRIALVGAVPAADE